MSLGGGKRVCVCVCVCGADTHAHAHTQGIDTHTHTCKHTHTHIMYLLSFRQVKADHEVMEVTKNGNSDVLVVMSLVVMTTHNI